MKHLPSVFFFLLGLFLRAQTIDIKHAEYHLSFFPEADSVRGTAAYKVKIRDAGKPVFFDAHRKVRISGVRVNGRKAKWHREGDSVRIDFPFKAKTYQIVFDFGVHKPVQALYFVGWHNGNRNQVWTQGQGKRHSRWMPVIDDVNERFTWEVHIDFPSGYEVASNGKLTEKKEDANRGRTLWTYRLDKPAPSYLLFIGAGKYAVRSESDMPVPYEAWDYPDAPQPPMTFSRSKDIFRAVSDLIGYPYPWDLYREIPLRDFIYGGMENVTASVFTDYYVVNDTMWPDANPVNVLAHELAHQWFGNYVTETSPTHHWLHESFATYFAWEAGGRLFGPDYTDYAYYRYLDDLLEAARKDTVPLLNGKASSLTFYQKGAWIVRMLHDSLGEERFRRVLHRFLDSHAYGNADTRDFQKALFEVTGDSMPRFFDRWFRTARIPTFRLLRRGDSLIVRGPGDLHLPVRFFYRNGSFADTLILSSVAIPRASEVVAWLPDPGRRMLAELDWSPSPSELEYLLRMPLRDVDVLRLVPRLHILPAERRRAILLDLAAWDYYYPVHAALLKTLKKEPDSILIPAVKKILGHGLKNRQAVAMHIPRIPRALRTDTESLLNDKSYVTITHAVWKLWNTFPSRRRFYLDKTKHMRGLHDRELRMLWIVMAISHRGYVSRAEKMRLLEELTDYASPDFNVETRITALEYIDMLKLINDKTKRYIREAADYFHPALRRKARELLKKYAIE
ncbi:MAG: M1 family metallopeptidase [Chlorobi bacterium]|nr:M1 family metallopeptidase [Chlorobiota bacterium]